MGEFVWHREPVWRNRSNAIVCGELSAHGESRGFEELYAKRIGDDLFEVCCIPFFLFDVALGDFVATAPDGDLGRILTKVVEPSGRRVFRVWFHESSPPRAAIAEELRSLGSLIEWSSRNFLALDAIDDVHAERVLEFLAARQESGELRYGAGRSP